MATNRIALTSSELAAVPTADKNQTPLMTIYDVIETDGSLSSYILLTAGQISPTAIKIAPADQSPYINDVYWQQCR